jgi:hypothetical protein
LASRRSTSGDGSKQQQQQQQQQDQQDAQQQQQETEGPQAEPEQETLYRLCPTYAADINSPLRCALACLRGAAVGRARSPTHPCVCCAALCFACRHVRTRIYFTSESHIHSLINVLRYSNLAHPSSAGSIGGSGMSRAPSMVAGQQLSAGAQASAAAEGGEPGAAAAADGAAAAAGPGGSGKPPTGSSSSSSSSTAAAPKATGSSTLPGPAFEGRTAFRSVFTSSAGAAAAAGAAGAAGGGGDGAPASAAASVTIDGSGALGSGALGSSGGSTSTVQPLLTPEGQALIDGTDEYDYLTHIVLRMYENKTVSEGVTVGGGE